MSPDGTDPNAAPPAVMLGRQSLTVPASFAAAYEQATDPVIVADRVWLARARERLLVHIGPIAVVDRSPPAR
jgi:hypothetical protein